MWNRKPYTCKFLEFVWAWDSNTLVVGYLNSLKKITTKGALVIAGIESNLKTSLIQKRNLPASQWDYLNSKVLLTVVTTNLYRIPISCLFLHCIASQILDCFQHITLITLYTEIVLPPWIIIVLPDNGCIANDIKSSIAFPYSVPHETGYMGNNQTCL